MNQETQQKFDTIQAAIDTLKQSVDSLFQSASIPREVETAFRQRLGISSTTKAIAVGGVYINTTNVNPATELGYGTWSALGAGQVLVGYKSGDSDFGTMGATGGEKTHTLTTNEMPSHTHDMHNFYSGTGSSTGIAGGGPATNVNTNTLSTGGGAAHNNLQPFVVVAIWQRTA